MQPMNWMRGLIVHQGNIEEEELELVIGENEGFK